MMCKIDQSHRTRHWNVGNGLLCYGGDCGQFILKPKIKWFHFFFIKSVVLLLSICWFKRRFLFFYYFCPVLGGLHRFSLLFGSVLHLVCVSLIFMCFLILLHSGRVKSLIEYKFPTFWFSFLNNVLSWGDTL